MEVKLESARLLTWKAAMLKDQGKAYVKVWSSDEHVITGQYSLIS